MKVLVCGSRYDDAPMSVMHDVCASIRDRIRELPKDTEIITGGASGVDQWAEYFAKMGGWPCRVFPADWKTHGRRAGILRNLQMLDEQPDLVIAFWDGESRGTAHTIREAQKRDVPVEVVTP